MYTANEDGTIGVRNCGYYSLFGWKGVTGSAYDIGVDGGLFVSFGGKTPNAETKPNYNVLYTDYTTYSIVYSGNIENFLFSFEMLWILSREKELAPEKMKEAEEKIAELLPHYNMAKYSHYTTQGATCPYDTQPAE